MTTHPATIEKSVPIPVANHSYKLYPLASMEVGDSFTLDAEQIKPFRSMLSYYIKNRAERFITRRVLTGGIFEYRIWRVK